MWCVVYPLYRSGVRLPAEEAQAGGLHGWMVYRLKLSGGLPHPHALLLPNSETSDLYPLLRLEHPSLTLVEGGIRMVGREWNVDYLRIKQGWWVIPGKETT